MNYFDYVNIVKVASRVKEYAWAEKFMRDFEDSLPDYEKENCYHLLLCDNLQ